MIKRQKCVNLSSLDELYVFIFAYLFDFSTLAASYKPNSENVMALCKTYIKTESKPHFIHNKTCPLLKLRHFTIHKKKQLFLKIDATRLKKVRTGETKVWKNKWS